MATINKAVPFPPFPEAVEMKEAKLMINFRMNEPRQSENKNDSKLLIYRLEAACQIQDNWIIPEDIKCSDNDKTRIEFTIFQNGSINDIYFKKESGCKELDDAAFSVVNKSAPFFPFPMDLDVKEIKLEIDFKSNGITLSKYNIYSNEDLYRLLVSYQVQENWIIPENFYCIGDITTSIVFTVIPNGNVEKILIVKKSDCKELDDAALAAIKRASPFRPFPKNLNVDSIELGIKFNANGM